jgi:hypothetical protein
VRAVSDPENPSFAPDQLEVAADRDALAAILAARGRHREAQATLWEVLAVVESVLGPDHYEVAVTLDKLAATVRRGGDAARAAELYERSLRIKRRLLGSDHADVAATRDELARCAPGAGGGDERAG